MVEQRERGEEKIRKLAERRTCRRLPPLALSLWLLVVQRVGALRHHPLGLAERRLRVPGCLRGGGGRSARACHRCRRRRRRLLLPPVPPRRHVRSGNPVAAAAEGGELRRQQQKHCQQHGW
jgi:hypothetical protein